MAVVERGVGAGRHVARSDGQLREVRAAAVPPAALPPAPYQRRWGRLAAGGVLVLGGGLVTASLFASAGDRVEVLALAGDVAENDTIERADLVRVRVGSDGDIATIPAGHLDEIVGRVAATDLTEDGLLSRGQLRSADDQVVGDNESVVGLLLSAGDAPLGQLVSGATVDVVVRPAAGDTGEVTVVDGWLLDTSGAAVQNGDRPVSVVVPTHQAGAVSSAAAEDRVSVAVREG